MVYGDFDNPNTSSPIFHNPFYTLSFIRSTKSKENFVIAKQKEGRNKTNIQQNYVWTL